MRERNSIANLSRQVFGGTGYPDRLSKAFQAICATAKDENKRPYLILDLRAKTPDQFRLRESFDIRKPQVSYETGYADEEDETR